MHKPDALSIAFSIADESPEIVKLLVIGHRTDGSIFINDTGLTVDEAIKMCRQFVSWMDSHLDDIERAAQEE